MDLDEPEPATQTGRKVSFSEVVEVKEIESIKKPGVKRKASTAGKSVTVKVPAKKKKVA